VSVVPQLPAAVQARPAEPGDLDQVVALCVRCDVADLGGPDTEPDDILAAWRRPVFDLRRDTVLVVADGEVVGYGDMFDGRDAFGMVDPGWRGRGIGGWLLRRIEQQARQRQASRASGRSQEAEVPTLEVSAPHSDQAFRELAERDGFRLARSSWLMRLDMSEPPLPAVLPDGVELRTSSGTPTPTRCTALSRTPSPTSATSHPAASTSGSRPAWNGPTSTRACDSWPPPAASWSA
jgi:GNAT superfamily N-acetyltransferase